MVRREPAQGQAAYVCGCCGEEQHFANMGWYDLELDAEVCRECAPALLCANLFIVMGFFGIRQGTEGECTILRGK